jgi:hypothetical protein
MSGANTTELLQGRAQLPAGESPVLRGYVSPDRPAPAGFPAPGSTANLLWVVIPDQTLDHVLGPCWWNADHGLTLPAQGAACVVIIDQAELATVIWWEGAHT